MTVGTMAEQRLASFAEIWGGHWERRTDSGVGDEMQCVASLVLKTWEGEHPGDLQPRDSVMQSRNRSIHATPASVTLG